MKSWMLAAWMTVCLLAAPVQAQVVRPTWFGSDGEKKVGGYVWVWHSQSIPPSGRSVITVDCPLNYVALGGGYKNNDYIIVSDMPNAAFDGWVIDAINGGSNPNKLPVTAYVACAPAK